MIITDLPSKVAIPVIIDLSKPEDLSPDRATKLENKFST